MRIFSSNFAWIRMDEQKKERKKEREKSKKEFRAAIKSRTLEGRR